LKGWVDRGVQTPGADTELNAVVTQMKIITAHLYFLVFNSLSQKSIFLQKGNPVSV